MTTKAFILLDLRTLMCQALISVACCCAVRAEETTPPSLIGYDSAIARQRAQLRGYKLVVGVFYIAPNNWRKDIRENRIYMQSPQPDSSPQGPLMAGWHLRRASKDQQIVTVPDVRGKSYVDAVTTLKQVQLAVAEQPVEDYPLPKDYFPVVADQYPRSKDSVYEGTSVFLVLKPSAK